MTDLVCLTLLFLMWMATNPPRVAIHVLPTMVMAGGTVRVVCTVPQRPENRELRVGLPDYLESSRDLEGERAAITHQLFFEHIPCVVDEAVCAVRALDGSFSAHQPVHVVGCDGE